MGAKKTIPKDCMNVVLDTNVLISGFLWKGVPSTILDAGRMGAFNICLTPLMLQELEEVLSYSRLQSPLLTAGKLPQDIIESLELSCIIKSDIAIPTVIKDDPTDDIILGAAISHHADFIVSGDHHLLKLKMFQGIPILSPRQFLNVIK